MITSNNSPYRVVLADSAGKTANNHPIKVFLEGGSDFATKEDIEELNTKIEALSTDLSYKGSVEDYAHLPSDAQTGDVYTTADTGVLYVWDGDEWVALNEQTSGLEAKLITKADYNYPETGEKTAFSFVVADSGVYQVGEDDMAFDNGGQSRFGLNSNSVITLIKGTDPTRGYALIEWNSGSTSGDTYLYMIGLGEYVASNTVYKRLLRTTDIVNNLVSQDFLLPLSARQGKVLDEKIESRVSVRNGAPTTSSSGTLGQLELDRVNGDLYQLKSIDTSVSPNVYHWQKVGSNLVTGSSAPTTSTEGELGQNYLDTTSGSVYVLTSIEEESGGEKVYNWEKIVKEKEACPIKISTADYDTTVEGDSAVALYNLAPGLYITTENMLLTSGVSGLGTFDVPSGVLVSISAWDVTHRLVQFDKNVFLTGVGVVGFTALPRTNSEMMFLTGNDVVDNIGGTIGVHRPISNRAVNDWKTQVEDMIDRHGSDPVSGEEVLPSSHRILGQIWINGNTGKIYVLVNIEPGVEDPTKVIYTWEELASAGVSVFTTNEWNALWA